MLSWVILANMCVKLLVRFFVCHILGPFWVHFGSILGPFGVQESVFRQESVFTQESMTRQESMFRQECSLDKNSSLDLKNVRAKRAKVCERSELRCEFSRRIG